MVCTLCLRGFIHGIFSCTSKRCYSKMRINFEGKFVSDADETGMVKLTEEGQKTKTGLE